MNGQRISLVAVLSCAVIAVSAITSGVVAKSVKENTTTGNKQTESPFHFTTERIVDNTATDFTHAAEQSIESVVHVKVKIKRETPTFGGGSFFDFFFGMPGNGRMDEQIQEGSGSGVILTEDGYIVTNNHVVDQATTVEVTLNDKRTFVANVIGTDPSTDLALLKIDADNLRPMVLGNSDDLRVGEWVLAVGNPFNLTSTVTAGIVSAKARNINILNSEMKIESFIQTDAAVNPGNSGGALVNTNGELVGINTAIASQTGNYSGYSFAIPTAIMSKVVNDLREYKVVQRAVLGVVIRDIDDELAKTEKLTQLNGVYVTEVLANGSGADAGLSQGDIIVAINGVATNSVAELQEQIGRHRPGDDVTIVYMRGNKKIEKSVKMKNRSGNTEIVKQGDDVALGATFDSLSEEMSNRFRLRGGVVVDKVERGGLMATAGIEKGFIILKINGQLTMNEKDLRRIVSETNSAEERDRVLFITGIYPSGKVMHYAVNLK